MFIQINYTKPKRIILVFFTKIQNISKQFTCTHEDVYKAGIHSKTHSLLGATFQDEIEQKMS